MKGLTSKQKETIVKVVRGTIIEILKSLIS